MIVDLCVSKGSDKFDSVFLFEYWRVASSTCLPQIERTNSSAFSTDDKHSLWERWTIYNGLALRLNGKMTHRQRLLKAFGRTVVFTFPSPAKFTIQFDFLFTSSFNDAHSLTSKNDQYTKKQNPHKMIN